MRGGIESGKSLTAVASLLCDTCLAPTRQALKGCGLDNMTVIIVQFRGKTPVPLTVPQLAGQATGPPVGVPFTAPLEDRESCGIDKDGSAGSGVQDGGSAGASSGRFRCIEDATMEDVGGDPSIITGLAADSGEEVRLTGAPSSAKFGAGGTIAGGPLESLAEFTGGESRKPGV